MSGTGGCEMGLGWELSLRFLSALVVFGVLLFAPAGSLKYWQGWAYLAVWFIPALLAFTYFYRRDPARVERRLKRKESVREQKLIMKFVYVIYVIAFLLPGFDHRFGWSHLPLWLTILSQLAVLGGSTLTFWIMKANPFASRAVQVEPGQK